MKKTNLLGALALASCVMLTGCKNKPEQETPKEIEVIVSGLPEVAIVGTEYDLDQYVTVKNSSVSYTIEIASESASKAEVSGHKFTAKDEGEIKFTVKVGDKSVEGSVMGRSAIRQSLIDLTKDFGHEYTVLDFMPDDGPDMLLHGDGYIQTQYWDFDEVAQVPLAGGFLKFPEHDGVYQYTEAITDIVEGVPEYEVVVDNEIYVNKYMDYFNGDVNTDFSSLTGLVREFDDELVEEGEDPLEVFTLSGKAARDFAENSFFLANGTYHFYLDPENPEPKETYEAPITKLEFTIADIADEGEDPFLVVDAYAFAEVYEDLTVEEPVKFETCVNLYRMTADPALVGDELVEAALKDPAKIPTGDGEGTRVANFLNSIPLFTDVLDYGFAASYEYGWFVNPDPNNPEDQGHYFDIESEEFAEFFAEEVEGYVVENAPKHGSAMRIFCQGGIMNLSSTYAPVDGLIQKTEVVDEESVTTVYAFNKDDESYDVSETSKYASIYADESLSLASLAKEIKGNSIYLQKEMVVGKTEEEDPKDIIGYMFGINTYEGDALIEALLKSDSGLLSLYNIAKERDMFSYFEGSIIYIPTYGSLMIHLELQWDEAGLYSYCVDLSVGVDFSGEIATMGHSYVDMLLTLVPEEAE